ncbi:MFS transporter [Salinisphaera hydrothermalis]
MSVVGWRRIEVIMLLAAVLGLDGADKCTIGAIATSLESALHIGNTEIGLLVTASTGVGALATLPLGILVDRINRKRLLTGAIVVWSIAMVVSAFAHSFSWLLLSRLGLGAIVATAFPAVASLAGDMFPSFERGRIWGYLLAGELLGTAFGFLVSGLLAGAVDWRAPFWALGLIGFTLAGLVAWRLPEPMRGGHALLPPYRHDRQQAHADDDREALAKEIEAFDIPARKDRVLTENPANMPLRKALAYVLTIRTNVALIVASALGYFYFTGIRTFAVVFMSGRFGLSESVASLTTVGLGLGSILGVLVTGQLADRLIARDKITARIVVGGLAFLVTAAVLLPALMSQMLWVAAPMLFLSAVALGGSNPPLDAARLDIIPSRLWGRAESIRTTLRYAFEAVAPLAFGYFSSLFGGGGGAYGPTSDTIEQGAQGLDDAFLLLLILPALAGVILLLAHSSYPRDTATALASERALADSENEARNRRESRTTSG